MFLSLQVRSHPAHTLRSPRASPTRTQAIPAVPCPGRSTQLTSRSSAARWHVRCGFSLGTWRFSKADASISAVWAFLLVVLFFSFKFYTEATGTESVEGRPCQYLADLPQLPALAHDAFRRPHRPNPLSADAAVAGLGSASRTHELSAKPKWKELHFQPRGESTDAKVCWASRIAIQPGGPKLGESPSVLPQCWLGGSRGNTN